VPRIVGRQLHVATAEARTVPACPGTWLWPLSVPKWSSVQSPRCALSRTGSVQLTRDMWIFVAPVRAFVSIHNSAYMKGCVRWDIQSSNVVCIFVKPPGVPTVKYTKVRKKFRVFLCNFANRTSVKWTDTVIWFFWGFVIIPTPGMNVRGLLVHSLRVTEGNHESVCDWEWFFIRDSNWGISELHTGQGTALTKCITLSSRN